MNSKKNSKEGCKEERSKNRGGKQEKKINKLVELKPTISIVTINVYEVNTPIKNQKLDRRIKKRQGPTIDAV